MLAAAGIGLMCRQPDHCGARCRGIRYIFSEFWRSRWELALRFPPRFLFYLLSQKLGLLEFRLRKKRTVETPEAQ